MASAESVISREEKEAQLNERIEEIRRKNAALQKRYEEVQADKKNADVESDKINASAASSASVRPQPLVQRDNGPKPERRLPVSQRLGRAGTKSPVTSTARDDLFFKSGEQQQRRTQRLREDDGPPPDPSYSFLADRTRNREENEKGEADDVRHRGSRRHTGNYGGKDFANAKTEMQKRRSYERNAPWKHSSNSKMDMELSMTGRERGEYERWRSERKVIEEARVNRQRTTSGEWRREWDKEKDHRQTTIKKRTSSNWKDAKLESAEDDHTLMATEQVIEQTTTPNRVVNVSNNTLNISITNERTAVEDLDDAQEYTPRSATESPPVTQAAPHTHRRWGSEDVWEDAGPWEVCEEGEEWPDAFEDNPDVASGVTENMKDKTELKNGNCIASDDNREVGERDPALTTSPNDVEVTGSSVKDSLAGFEKLPTLDDCDDVKGFQTESPPESCPRRFKEF